MNHLKHLTLAVLLYAGSAFPWGKVGHETVAYIAEKNLSSSTMNKIKPLLSGESLENISTWADDYKRGHRNTAPWHYINLPVRENVTVNDLSRYYSSNPRHSDDNLIVQT
ncbi:MAG: S1/P1 nuclease, partial [Candidatus Paceibacterota bacterium]